MKTASRIKLAATVASVVRASTRPGAPGLAERVHAVPRLVRSTRSGAYAGTTFRRLSLVAAAVAYVASPIDLLPEAVLPVLGPADDAVVISWAIKAFFEETDRFIAWELGQGIHGGTTVRGTTVRGTTRGSGSAGTAPGSAGTAPGSAGTAPRPGGWAQRSWRATGGTSPTPDHDVTGAAAPGRGDRLRLPEGARQAAADYVLESVRKRLER
jgi:uncharacterized membrane protein YkvA (DUF1232 family)